MDLSMFEADLNQLQNLLANGDIDNSEVKYRMKRIRSIYRVMYESDTVNEQYYQLAHEIRSWDFLRSFGKTNLTNDSKRQNGADIVFQDNYHIECVCSTLGDEKNGLGKYCLHNGQIIDYGAKKDILNSRLTQAITGKVDYYRARAGRSIPAESPYIIHLGLGALAYEFYAGEYGFALTEILFGKGNPQIVANGFTGEIVETGFSHRNIFHKWNGQELNCNLYLLQEFDCVSGIIFTKADLLQPYNCNNSWLFINPFAKVKISLEIFEGIVYWNMNSKRVYEPISPTPRTVDPTTPSTDV